jgi:hypothetical protein
MKRLSWAVATVIGLAVGAVAAAPAATARPACTAHPSGRVVTLRADDVGRTVCAHRGQEIDVVLVVDPVEGTVPEQWWHPVELSGAALTVLPMTLMAVQGTTLARYRASAHGRATLSSERHPCAPPPPGGVSCDTIESWSVTVLVR